MHDGERDGDDLRARVHAADPAVSLPPAPAADAARLMENAMTDESDALTHAESRADHTHGRSPLTWLVAAASVLVMVGAAVWAFQLRDDTEPVPVATPEQSVTELAVPRGAAKCMVPTAEVLGQQPLAFEGIVQALEDDEAVLEPTRVFAGERTDLVRVQAPTSAEVALIGFVDFEVGERYLVAANDGIVTVCGFSGPVTPELTALYAEAFPG